MLKRLLRCIAVGLALLLAFSLIGCGGSNSTPNEAQVEAVTVNDNGTTATMTVAFNVSTNPPVTDLNSNSVRFTVAKLVPGINGDPSYWQSYINETEITEADDEGNPIGNAPDGTPTPIGTSAIQATYERGSGGGEFTNNGDGSYTYKLSINFRAVTGVTWEPDLTHRIAMQISDNATNATYDFVPNSKNATPDTRAIVDNVACSECHLRLGLHGGDRNAVEYCVTCHNPGSTDANSGNTVDFKVMIHKIHSGEDGPEVEAGGEYAIWGFNDNKHDYSEVHFPQDRRNCIKCHDNTNPATPDADNWKNVPSDAACTACHDAPDPVEYPTFPDLAAAEIEAAHVTANATPHNPNLPPGVPNIQYELIQATVDADNQAVITFRILQDGMPLDLFDRDKNLPAGSSFDSRWPDFLLAYALPQDNIDEPAQYNNLGRDSAQPLTVDLDQLGPVNNNDGTMVDNGDGTYTATTGGTTYPSPPGAFPAGATLRAVGLQGYFRVVVDGETISLHTPSAVIAVDGDEERVEVVDSNNCSSCHEWFEGHGGNRVFNMNICVFCHNPNLSSSGRRIDPLEPPSDEVQDAYGPDPLQYPEATNNFKDMIHGIHSGAFRTTKYEFVRDRNDGIPYDWSHVVFPQREGNTSNCLACHKPGSFAIPLVDNALLTTNRTTGAVDGMDADFNAVLAARAAVPNDTDFTITPTAGACYACHDSDDEKAHMELNGAAINENRIDVVAAASIETCSVCHGEGKIADVEEVHKEEVETVVISAIAPPPSDGGGGGSSQEELCGPGPIGAQPAGHTDSLDCCSCHGFN